MMRSVLEIIIAVKDQQPATDEELRLCIVALSAMQTMDGMQLHELAESVIDGTASAKLRARHVMREAEIRFKSMKMPVDKYLGPRNTPGTPENDRSVRIAKNILKKATGIDLDAPIPDRSEP